MSDAFVYAKVDKSNSWDMLFSSMNANFEGINRFLSSTSDLVTAIERFKPARNQTVFTLQSQYIMNTNSLAVYRNGVRLWNNIGFSETSTNSFEMIEPTNPDDYIVAVVSSLGQIEKQISATVETQVAMQGQQAFQLEKAYSPNTNSVVVYRNNVKMASGRDFTETSPRVITFKEKCDYKDTIVIIANLKLASAITAIPEMVGCTDIAAGFSGLVPKPEAGYQNRFLRADGYWMSPATLKGATKTEVGTKGLVPQPLVADIDKVLFGDGTWRYVQNITTEGDTLSDISQGRDIATIRRSSYLGYAPILSQKTGSGSWEVASDGEYLVFNYITDSDYQRKDNTASYQVIYSPVEKKIKGLITNAEIANKWLNPIVLSVTGDASGSVSIDGSEDVSLDLSIEKLGSPVRIALMGDATGAIDFDGVEDKILRVSVLNATESQAGKMKLYNSVGNNTDGTMTQQAITSLLSSLYRFKGSVDSYYDLPTRDNQVGDTYNILNPNLENNILRGDNVAWYGTGWAKLAGTFDFSEFVKVTDSYIESISIDNKTITFTPSTGNSYTIDVGSDYELPVATDSVLGGVKVGSNLKITSKGVLSGDYGVAQYDEELGIRKNGLLSWEDKKKIDAINLEQVVNEITSVDGIKIGNMDVDEDGVITLTKQNVINALGFTPLSKDDIISISTDTMVSLVDSVPIDAESSGEEYVNNSNKLYSTLGDNVDGSLTQSALSSLITELNNRINSLEIINSNIDNGYIKLSDTWYRMKDIYYSYSTIEELPNPIDISELTIAEGMFEDCSGLSEINPIDTSNLVSMREMFKNCSSLPANFSWVLDLSSIEDIEDIQNIFEGSSVTNVVLKNVSNEVSSYINSMALKGDNTLVIEYR